eukprot:scaffold47297_cov45-Phaeocystis_antarctica.AAC.1
MTRRVGRRRSSGGDAASARDARAATAASARAVPTCRGSEGRARCGRRAWGGAASRWSPSCPRWMRTATCCACRRACHRRRMRSAPNPNPGPNPSPNPDPSPSPNPDPSPNPNRDPDPDPKPFQERVSAQQLAALHGFVRQLGGAADILDGWYAKTETRRQGTSAGSTDTCACPLPSPHPRAHAPLISSPSLPWQLLFSRVGQTVSISDRGCALARAGHRGTAAEAKEDEGSSLRCFGDDGRGTAVWHGEPHWRGRPGRTCQGLADDDSPPRRGGGWARLRVVSSPLHPC